MPESLEEILQGPLLVGKQGVLPYPVAAPALVFQGASGADSHLRPVDIMLSVHQFEQISRQASAEILAFKPLKISRLYVGPCFSEDAGSCSRATVDTA